MKLVTTIQTEHEPPATIAMVARGFLYGVVLTNCLQIRRKLVPPIYESGVKFRPEPWQGRFEEFADALTTYRRGWGDCDDLVAWRVAELRAIGDRRLGLTPCNATIKIYWRPKTGGFHCEVRMPDGSVEDVSRFLGMGKPGTAVGT